MAETAVTPLYERIKIGLDGRSNKWLKEKLLERGITLSDASLSQRLSGQVEWTGKEAIACFDILNMEIKSDNASV